MFTLTTNLSVWMAAVVDESVHQASSHGASHGNASHAHSAPGGECPSKQVAPGPGSAGPHTGRALLPPPAPGSDSATWVWMTPEGECQGYLLILEGVVSAPTFRCPCH